MHVQKPHKGGSTSPTYPILQSLHVANLPTSTSTPSKTLFTQILPTSSIPLRFSHGLENTVPILKIPYADCIDRQKYTTYHLRQLNNNPVSFEKKKYRLPTPLHQSSYRAENSTQYTDSFCQTITWVMLS